MVFLLSHDVKDDEENNNQSLGAPSPYARRRLGTPLGNTTPPPARGGRAGRDEDDGCCGCCPPLFHRRHSAKVSPEKRQVFDLDNMYTVLDAQPVQLYDAPLTLDSIDSSSENQLQQTNHAPPQKPVLARPANTSPPANTAPAPHSAPLRGPPSAHHPLAPPETETSSPRNDSANSSRTSVNTSANTSSSTVSLHNGHTSAVTSGYYSTSPGTGASGASVHNAEPFTRQESPGDDDYNNQQRDELHRGQHHLISDSHKTTDAEDAVDGESYAVVEAPQLDRRSEDPPQRVDRLRGGARRVDISPPPKRQSAAATRRTPVRPGRGVRVPLNRPRATTPGSLGNSAGAASLASMTNGSLSSSLGNSTASLFADTLPSFDNPREALNRALQQLDSMEWEVTIQALQTMVGLVRHHPGVIQGQLHPCCESLSRQVKNLRSQVARAACQAATYMFNNLKRGMDPEAEDLSTALFNRTADTNKFLRADANAALDSMTDNVTPAKAVTAIVHKGCRHQNAVVRAAGARLLARLVDKLGVERMMSQPRETRDLMLLTSARLLMEGSLETRSYTKTLFKNLAQDHRLSSILVEIVPSNVMRSIDKTLKSCILRK